MTTIHRNKVPGKQFNGSQRIHCLYSGRSNILVETDISPNLPFRRIGTPVKPHLHINKIILNYYGIINR